MSNSPILYPQDKSKEEQIWNAFRNGSQDAFNLLYQKYYQVLFNLGMSYCGEMELTKDCIQDFFVYLWKHHKNLSQTKSTSFYLKSSFRRRLQKYLDKKRQQEYKCRNNLPIESSRELSIESILIKQEEDLSRNSLVGDMMNMLSNRQKEIVYMRYYQNLNPTDISKKLNISYQTVVNHLTMAFKVLREDTETKMQYHMV